MRHFVEMAAMPSRGRFRSLKISSTVLLIFLLLATAPWQPAVAVALEPWSQPWWPGGPVFCGDLLPGLEQYVQCNDEYGVRIAVSDATGTEGTDATIDFVVSLSKPHPYFNVTMDWSIEAITATAGEDYTDASGTLTIALGETTGTISIPLLDDSVSEGVETLKLKLANASGATFVRGGMAGQSLSARGTVLPDEDTDAPTVTVTAEYPITPPVSGWFHVLVQFSEPVKGFETSDIEVTNGSVASISRQYYEYDKTKWSAKIVPASGVNGDVSVKVPAAAATDLFENANTASETFVVAARGATTQGRKAFVTCSIPPDQASWESRAGGLGLRRSNVSVRVGFGTANGTAPSGLHTDDIALTAADGVSAGGFLGVCTGPGNSLTCTYNTTTYEGVSGQLTLQVLAGAITDRYSGPSLPSDPMYIAGDNWTVSVGDASATEESGNPLDFEVKLNARDDCREVTVNYATADGTATASEDYTAVSGTLTFAPGETSKTVSVPIIDDSVSDSGETFTLQLSNVSGHLVELGVAEATGTITDDDPDLPTARFENVPDSHDGATAFTVELHFSENIPGLSYKTVAGGLLDVTGANVTGARRLTAGSNQDWLVTVAPGGSDDIAISLPARACGAAATICISDNRPLSEGISATVQMEPQAAQQSGGGTLTARFENVPESHDGATAFTVELHFSENIPGLSYKTVGGGLLDATGANVTGARRLTAGSNQDWLVTVAPSVDADVTLTVPGTDDCEAPHAICVGDDRKLEAGASATITVTPIAVTVADTEVEEAEGATLDFVVSMDRASARDIQIWYRASDGTATAGEDYVAAYSSFTMTAGETTKTVSVSVLDDAHDEGTETVKFWLSGVRGLLASQLTDPYAVGTIRNSDPIPAAWIARFGRTVGTHVTDAVGERLRSASGEASHVTVGGVRLPVGKTRPGSPGEGEPEAGAGPAVLQGLAGILGLGSAGTGAAVGQTGVGLGLAPLAAQPDPRLGSSQAPNFDLRRLLLGSSFRLALGRDPAGSGPRLTAWGRVAGTQFDGRDRDFSLDGDVVTGTVGVDGIWDRVLAGVAVSHSRGSGSFAMPGAAAGGELEQSLTSIHPYLRYAVHDRLDVWGMLGYGWGDLTLEPGAGGTLETDTALAMGAFGGRGILLPATETGGFELATRTDAMLTRTTSDAVTGMKSAEADAHRLRLILEGSRMVTWATGQRLTPSVEVGLRHDWGDAETGFGVELGGRLRYTDPRVGLTIEGAVRALLAHEDSDYEEWGASGSLRIDPGATGHGLSLTLAPAWGAASSGVDGLWTRQTTAGLAQTNRSAPTGRLNAEVGYGFPAFDTGRLTPYAGTVFTDGAARTYRLGTRLQMSGSGATGLMLSLEGQRQELAGQQPPNQGLQFQATWGF